MKLLNTGKAEILAIKLPDNAKAWMNETYHVNTLWYKTPDMRNPKHVQLDSKHSYSILGFVKDLTEEQFSDITEEILEDSRCGGLVYPNYYLPSKSDLTFKTAKESFYSFLESNEIYTVNPWAIAYQFDQCRAWQVKEAEEKTGNWLIIKAEKI